MSHNKLHPFNIVMVEFFDIKANLIKAKDSDRSVLSIGHKQIAHKKQN